MKMLVSCLDSISRTVLRRDASDPTCGTSDQLGIRTSRIKTLLSICSGPRHHYRSDTHIPQRKETRT